MMGAMARNGGSTTGLSSGVETQHQQAHLLGAEDLGHHLGYRGSHNVGYSLYFAGMGV